MMHRRGRRLLGGAVLFLAACAPGWAATQDSSIAVFSGASTAAETSHVAAAFPSVLYGASITTGAVAGYFMILNATSDPGNGAVTPLKCVAVGANQTAALSPDPNTAWAFSTGIVLVFSTTGCFTETQSATAFFSWQRRQ